MSTSASEATGKRFSYGAWIRRILAQRLIADLANDAPYIRNVTRRWRARKAVKGMIRSLQNEAALFEQRMARKAEREDT